MLNSVANKIDSNALEIQKLAVIYFLTVTVRAFDKEERITKSLKIIKSVDSNNYLLATWLIL